MGYRVKDIYYTLQGEGARAGMAAVFLRFSGCNLWSGHEADRASAVCKFCDTDFVGGMRFDDAKALAERVLEAWGGDTRLKMVVCTGGEPLLQLDRALIRALMNRGFLVAVETNGTIPAPPGTWVTVSPKAGTEVVVTNGDELKLVYPQEGAEPERFEQWAFSHHFLQPMDGPRLAENTRMAAEYCMAHPRWRLSLQTHKFIGIA